MKIAILAWGSLVWNPGELKITGLWNRDGPSLPIEFARKSKDGRLTLVLFAGAKRVETLWAFSKSQNIQEAICNLAKREGTTVKNIGYVSINENERSSRDETHVLPLIESWAKNKKLDAVIWTNLPPKFDEDFSVENALNYLKGLDPSDAHNAEKYVRYAPNQIKTELRSRLEIELGWTPLTEKNEQDWACRKKDFEGRAIHKTEDDSIWAVVPSMPSAFGHLMIISWKSRYENDITDEGLFIDRNHMQTIMEIVHSFAVAMKTHLTSNGHISGKKCERVYILSECETEDFPFHFHLIPRFNSENKGNLFLFQREMEEARWIVGEDKDSTKSEEGRNRIRKTEEVLKQHEALLNSTEWGLPNIERERFVGKIADWWNSLKIAERQFERKTNS